MKSKKVKVLTPIGRTVKIMNLYLRPPTVVYITENDISEFIERLKILGYKFEIEGSKTKTAPKASQQKPNEEAKAKQESDSTTKTNQTKTETDKKATTDESKQIKNNDKKPRGRSRKK